MRLVIELSDEKWQSVLDGTWCGSEEIMHGVPLEERTETHACESKSCETHEERTAEPCWIPVSERLPEKNGEYLITGRQGAVNKRRYHDGYWYGNWSVIAWMPLPEPYKAESKLDGDPIDIDNAVEHYEGTLETLKGIDLEDKA